MLGSMHPAAMFAYMAFNLFSVPCMAAVGAAIGELNSRKRSAQAIGFWLLTAYVVSFVVFWLGNFNTYMMPMSVVVLVIIAALIGFLTYRLIKKNKAARAATTAGAAMETVAVDWERKENDE